MAQKIEMQPCPFCGEEPKVMAWCASSYWDESRRPKPPRKRYVAHAQCVCGCRMDGATVDATNDGIGLKWAKQALAKKWNQRNEAIFTNNPRISSLLEVLAKETKEKPAPVRVWRRNYQAFVMGGYPDRKIATLLDPEYISDTKSVKDVCLWEVRTTDQTYIFDSASGGFVGTSMEEVLYALNDALAREDWDLIQSQVENGIREGTTETTMVSLEILF